MAASATGDLCACGSGRDYAACCEPAISGTRPATTPEALMRSRYTAYTRNDNAYLLATWHASTRPTAAPCDEAVDWQGLDIIRSTGNNPDDREGTVEFNARCLVNGRPGGLHEVSSFVREDSVWFYLDGTARPPIRNENKTGRNEPCPCGSGLKYKRCCGA